MATQILERPVIDDRERHRWVWGLFSSVISTPRERSKRGEPGPADPAQSHYADYLRWTLGLAGP